MNWIVVIVVVAGITAFAAVQDSGRPVANNGTVTNNSSITNQAPVTQAPVEDVHPVSIPALSAYQLTGRDLKLGPVQSRSNLYTRYSVTYKSDELTISGILNIPNGAGPFPVLFLNHGYIDPAVYTNGRGLKREQDYFARQGFAVLHSDYRCHAGSDCPPDDPLAQRLFYAKDVMNAIQAVKDSGDRRLSTTAFGLLGHSMGGGVAQTIMVAKPELVQAVVLYAPVSSEYRDSFQRYTQRRPADVAKIIAIYGQPDDAVSFWDGLAPRNYFARVTAPIEIYQGTNDADVPKSWADETVELLQAAGKSVRYQVYQGQPHEFTPPTWNRFMDSAAAFFRAHLRL